MGVDRLDARGQLDLLMLSVLKTGGAHGYAIISTIREQSEGALELPEATVYPALRRLERLGLIAGEWERHQGRQRKVYELTPAGAKVLSEEQRDWRRYAAGVDAVLRWA